MRTIFAATIAVALLATPALAQEKQPEARHDMMQMMQSQGGMMEMMQGGMMGMDAGPTMILKLKESLELSEDQVKRLTAIQKSAKSGMQQHMMEGMHAMQGAEKLLEPASPDFGAYEAALRNAANHMVLAHTAMARADAEARQVLNPQQRERLTLARKVMKEMKDGMMKDSMMKGGMMKDGMKPMRDDGSVQHHQSQ